MCSAFSETGAMAFAHKKDDGDCVNVYVLFGCVKQYGVDGRFLLNVFSTESKAKREMEQQKRWSNYDYYEIVPVEVK